MEKRVAWVDFAKAIGIFLVILVHTPLNQDALSYIYVFGMPLFFFISGYLFSFDKYPNYKLFIKSRFKRLITPYLFFTAITYLFWFFIGRKFGNDSILNIEWYVPILGAIYGVGKNPWMIHCIPLWFITCLFVVENLYYLLFKNFNNFFLIIGFLALGMIETRLNNYVLPWNINIAFYAIIFYAAGNLFKNKSEFLPKFKFYQFLIVAILLFIGVEVISLLNGKIAMHTKTFGNLFYFYLGGFTGIMAVYSLSVVLGNLKIKNSLIKYISSNTLTILGIHLIIGSILKAITVFILNMPLSIYSDQLWINVLFSLVSLAICLPIIYIFNIWIPVLIGNWSNRN